jgi:hypothetical protein
VDGFAPVEYKVVDIEGIITLDAPQFEAHLNDLGKDGWELVAWNQQTMVLVFKRS